jgi:hypothetical protein
MEVPNTQSRTPDTGDKWFDRMRPEVVRNERLSLASQSLSDVQAVSRPNTNTGRDTTLNEFPDSDDLLRQLGFYDIGR